MENNSNPNETLNVKSSNFYIDWFEVTLCTLCFLGTFTSILNIIIFLNKKLKDQTYNYMLVISMVDFAYITIIGFEITFKCGSFCDILKNSYATQVYTLWFADYLTSCLAIMNILIELFVSIQRLFIILNKKFLQNVSFRIVLILISLVSIVYYIPVLFVRKIAHDPSLNIFKIVFTEFGDSNFGKSVPSVLSMIRLFFVLVCLSIVNFITFIEFKKHFSKKKKLKFNKTKSSKINNTSSK